jgi:hypothetical protein
VKEDELMLLLIEHSEAKELGYKDNAEEGSAEAEIRNK